MPQRELKRKSVVCPVIGGANQRVRDVELPLEQYSLLEGVFPEFAGLQSRLWGKRTLAKYASSIYGIHQFWTPYGYGGGLYQFDGSLDYGQWITPVSNFDLGLTDLPWDGGGFTLDEFGYSYGSNFGYGTDNACVISFLDGSTQHSVCQPPPVVMGTPDDTNGGPAGQGKLCKWEVTSQVDYVLPAVVEIEYGEHGREVETASGPVPYPIYPNIFPEKPTTYAPGGGPFGAILYGQWTAYSYKTNFGGGSWRDTQGANWNNTRAVLDFTGIIDLDDPPIAVEFKVRHNPGPLPAPVYLYFPVAGLTMGEGGNYNNYPVDVADYIIPSYRQGPNPLGGGFVYNDFIQIEGVRIKHGKRICS